jgi:hypothetical protein
MINVKETFEKFEDEFLKSKDKHCDLAAFMRLYDIGALPSGDIVAAAEHDEIWLSVEVKTLAKVASEEDIKFLVERGVRYDSDTDSLALFV